MAEKCDTCPFHDREVYRTDAVVKDVDELESCVGQLKQDMQIIKTNQAVMQQKFDNIRVPIWIIFAAVLAQIAKWIVTFGPALEVAVK